MVSPFCVAIRAVTSDYLGGGGVVSPLTSPVSPKGVGQGGN